MPSSKSQTPSVQHALRDTKIAFIVHSAGLLAGAVFIGIGMAFGQDESIELVLKVMGGVIAVVAVLWALVMSVRGFLKPQFRSARRLFAYRFVSITELLLSFWRWNKAPWRLA